MESFFEAGPRLFSPAWRFSSGFVLGFYPLVLPWWLRALVGLGLGLFAFLRAVPRASDRGEPVSSIAVRSPLLVAAFALGILVGCLYSAFGFGLPDKIGNQGSEAPEGSSEPSASLDVAGRRLERLKVVGLAATLSADSRPARAGQRLMDLDAERIFVEGPAMSGSYTSKAKIRAIVREGPPLAAGAKIELRGRLAADGSPLLFAQRRDLLLRDEGSIPARLRNLSHEAFLASILAALGRNREEIDAAAAAEPELDVAAGLLLALLAGWQDELSPEDAAAFKAAGCTHILALSGQHLALIAAGLVFALRPLIGPLRALPPTFGLVWLYVIVVGPGPSLLRALLSFGLVALASLSDRPQDGRTILGLCFAAHALLFPDQLREAGFVLSYLAVGGLVVLAPRVEYLLSPYVPPPLSTALAASLAAQLATSPWIALSFGIVQPVGILATLATATLVEAVMIGGLLAALIVAILPMAALVTAPVELFLLRFLEEAMRFFAALPSLKLANPTEGLIAAFAIVLLASFLYALPHVRFSGRSRQAACFVDGPSRI